MKNMCTIFMNINIIYTFCINISAYMISLFYY